MTEDRGLAICPECGSENVYGVTRVVGYFSRIENWNPSKIGELVDRQKGDYSIGEETAKPLNLSCGEDGLYMFGKYNCPLCEAGDKTIQRALETAGLEGKFAAHVFKIAKDREPKILARAAMMDIPLSSIPAFAFVKDGKVVEVVPTIYEEGKPARLITQKDLAEKLKKYFAHESN